MPKRWFLSAALLVVLLAPGALAAAAGRSKRGVASGRYLQSRPAVLAHLGASWSYDWSANPPPRTAGLDWVPMVWGRGSLTPHVLATLSAAHRSGRAHYLLAFNEPDSRSQSNLTPLQAANLWPKLEMTGLRLGSPAPQVPTDGWLARFMALARARHLRVDFIALHYYQDFTDPNAVASLRSQLRALHHRFGKPIWITEIGALDIRRWGEHMAHAPSTALAVSYMDKLFAMLDALPFVQRYAWFMDDCWSDSGCRDSSLFTSSGRLTAAGSTFRSAP